MTTQVTLLQASSTQPSTPASPIRTVADKSWNHLTTTELIYQGWENASSTTKTAVLGAVCLLGSVLTTSPLERSLFLGSGLVVLAGAGCQYLTNSSFYDLAASTVKACLNRAPTHLTETFKSRDKSSDMAETEFTTTTVNLPNAILVRRFSETISTKALYNLNHELQSITFANKNDNVYMERKGNCILIIQFTGEEKKSYEIKLPNPSLPWIQQSQGFRPFLLSWNQEIEFYGVDPICLAVRHYKAVKTSRIEDQVYGDSQKIEIRYSRGLSINVDAPLLEAWHSPKTGQLHTLNYNFSDEIYGSSKVITPSSVNDQ